jgi:glycosyltransferase involved in cell wall biosynthesis
MHNLTKIKLFRTLLWCTYLPALLFLWPLAQMRRRHGSHLFFFFDRYALGGAQRVHIDILNSLPRQPKMVFFTRRSPNDTFKQEFYTVPDTTCYDVHVWCDNLLLRLFAVHYFCFYVNAHSKAHVLSANSTFFYDMLPFLAKHVVTTELLHNFTYGNNGMEFFGLANHHRLNFRIILDNLTKQHIEQQYKQYNIGAEYLSRLRFFEPGVDMPVAVEKNFALPLKVLYAGRGGPQKRVWLIDQIAQHFIRQGTPIQFHFAGNMEAELSALVKQNAVVYGSVRDATAMQSIYAAAHVILLTSAYEGFPMVIKEGMANGCVPVVTALVGNKTHLKQGENALLIESIEDETAVVKEGIACLQQLMQNKDLLSRLSADCRRYASQHFKKAIFESQYQTFLNA